MEEETTVNDKSPITAPHAKWTVRRRVVISTLLFCGVCVGYMVYNGGNDAVHNTAISSLTLLAASVIGSYVFGAVWSDIKTKR